MYQFKVKLDKQSYIDFNMNHLDTMPGMKKKLQLQRFIYPLMLIAIPFLFFESNKTIGFLIAGLGIIAWMSLYPKYIKRSIAKKVDGVLKKSTIALEEFDLTINDEYIKETRKGEDIFREWSRSYIITESERNYYVYFGLSEASIIPKNVFESKEKELEFVKFCNDKINEFKQ